MVKFEVARVAPAPTQQSGITRGQVAAAVIGNGLEFYDFTIFALFAKEIGRARSFRPDPISSA